MSLRTLLLLGSLLMLLLPAAGCRKQTPALSAEQDTSAGLSRPDPMDDPEARQKMAALKKRLEEAGSPGETAAVWESAMAEEGADIEILLSPEGETVGWWDKKTGVLVAQAEGLTWPEALPGGFPRFTAVPPNGIIADPSGSVTMTFSVTESGPVSAYVETLRAEGWVEVQGYTDPEQIVYEGKKETATLSVVYAKGSLVITFTNQ